MNVANVSPDSRDHAPCERRHSDAHVSGKRLSTTIFLNLAITIAQIIGGLVSGSLSLLSDAIHNFSDSIAMIVSYIAIRLGRQPESARYTFGLKRAEILAPALNAGTLIVVCFFLLKEAYERLKVPQPVSGLLMIAVAALGLVANMAGTLLLKKGSEENMNIRSAYIHLLGDALSSAGVIVGGVFIYFFKIFWIDPALTIVISIYILKGSIEIVKEAVNVLMMGAPQHVSIEKIKKELEDIPEIKNIHHVHVWRLSDKHIHFEAHVDVTDMPVSQTEPLSALIEQKLKHNHGIAHVTLQFETDKCESKRLI